ncbi:MAG: DEAD/DEAH box helicase [Flavobacteriales bacterium]
MNALIEQVNKQLKGRPSVVVHAAPDAYLDHLWPLVDEIIPHPEEGSPRAIILCASDEDARHIEAYFQKAAKAKDLTVDLVVEKGNKLKQRNDLFDGTEIIVGTTKRVCEMYFQNGFNIKKLKLFVVLRMDEQMRAGQKGFVARLAESLPKCKHVLFAQHSEDERMISYMDEFVVNYSTVELSE